jgi:hypothetical protein
MLTGVVWTALGPRWDGRDGRVPSCSEVIAFLSSQGADSAAEEYVRKAPRQVRTRYREEIERHLGWIPV